MNLEDLKQMLQDDLITLLDQFNDRGVTTIACQIVVDRVKEYRNDNPQKENLEDIEQKYLNRDY